MRKRKSLKKDDESDGSEGGVEPEEFQDSGEDWTPDADSVMVVVYFIVLVDFSSPSVILKFVNTILLKHIHIYK